MTRKVSHVHKLVAETAQAMCYEAYDVLMKQNKFYEIWQKNWPDLNAKQLEKKFVDLNWHKYVPSARATLAGMLSGPYDPDLKESIMNALMLDRTLVRGRGIVQ